MSGLRLLLDHTIDADVAAGLRKSGHDVCCAGEIGMIQREAIVLLLVRRVTGPGIAGLFAPSGCILLPVR